MCRQVEVSATDGSRIPRSPTECGVSEYDREASIMKRPWPTRGCRTMGGGNATRYQVLIPHKRSEIIVTFILVITDS